MHKKIAILGSTGSIGVNTLRVIEGLGSDYEVFALTAHNNAELLAKQAKQFKPACIAITNPEKESELVAMLGDFAGKILIGPKAMIEIAEIDEVDTLVTAVVGAAGLPAVLRAAEKGKTLAIANKEPLVIAGELLTKVAKENNATILPIDSEHSAIFQSLQSGNINEVSRIILTASGGPFRTAKPEDMENVTLEEALTHPTWNMGPKITVDSATMMNKALEVIEAVWLFGVPVDKIEILIHPESVIHSMVEFVDGSIIAQLGTPDMCVPIQYALTYPQRKAGIASHLKLDEIAKLTFEKPNYELFRTIGLGFEVAKKGGSAPVVFNAANEAAVEKFLAGEIKFAMIVKIIEHCVNEHEHLANVSLEELLEADRWARKEAESYIASRNS
jgi:1-deoxy-D-xylulose-5-phosphate reductoisomerase